LPSFNSEEEPQPLALEFIPEEGKSLIESSARSNQPFNPYIDESQPQKRSKNARRNSKVVKFEISPQSKPLTNLEIPLIQPIRNKNSVASDAEFLMEQKSPLILKEHVKSLRLSLSHKEHQVHSEAKPMISMKIQKDPDERDSPMML
jgi:hypothetical protein